MSSKINQHSVHQSHLFLIKNKRLVTRGQTSLSIADLRLHRTLVDLVWQNPHFIETFKLNTRLWFKPGARIWDYSAERIEPF